MNVRELFESALALSPSQRNDFLAHRCLDAAQRVAVERLLSADAARGERALDRSFGAMLDRLGDAETVVEPPAPGACIGPFLLRERLGEGGSSIVYRAEREQVGVTQVVALKLLRRGIYSPDEHARFRRERLALAQLRHPGIARLIEGGVTDAGVPYIALELVDGMAITEHVRKHRLDLPSRLRLFVATCRAVDAAHRALIVHRDLKPSNVLVTGDGEVKLLDFGIARLLDDDTALDPTRTLHRAMTPAYAAPEQFAGGAITTATDVYALGVLLGELVSGRRLNESKGAVPASCISGDESAGVLPEPAALMRRHLRGDLGAIVQKALSEEPERRYASAAEFADDVRRLLEARPVSARKPTRRYRMHRFVQRHRGAVATTATFVVALLAAFATVAWQANVARREANRARAVQGFLAELMEPLRAGLPQGKAPSLSEMLNTGIARLDRRFVDDIGASAEMNALFARISRQIGDVETARRLAPRAYQMSAAAFGEDDMRTLSALEERGRAALTSGRIADALADFERANAGMKALGREDFARANALADMSLAYSRLGRHADAIAAAREAYAIAEYAPAAPESNLGLIMNNLAGTYADADDREQEALWGQKAYDWMAAHGEGETTNGLILLGNLGNTQFGLGRWHEALTLVEHTLALQKRIPDGNPYPVWSNHVMACSAGIALNLLVQAERHCVEALDIARRKDGVESDRYATTLTFLALLRVRQGDYSAAKGDLRVADRVFKSLEGDHSRHSSRMAAIEAEMTRVAGNPAQTTAALAAAVATIDPVKATNAPLLFAQFALACTVQPLPACRDDSAARARALLESPNFRQHPVRLPSQTALARWSALRGDTPVDLSPLQAAIGETAAQLGSTHPWVGEAQATMAQLAAASGQTDLAARARHEAKRSIDTLPRRHPLRIHLERILDGA